MKKRLLSLLTVAVLASPLSASAGTMDNVGVAVNYGLISGAALEVTYPINDVLQVRGALSSGMGLSETSNDTDVVYNVEADGSINRLSLDYHPFESSFFVSGGYAFNDFKLKTNGVEVGAVVVGNTTINGTVAINGQIDWNSAPMLSLGWGHSPAQGWGALFEVGAIFTGAPNTALTGTLNGANDAALNAALADEEAKLKADIGDFDFLPILQAGVTYRF
ncbi:MAG: hypothetical protein GXO35_05855 [Gammaproteobacteria bacterium]|nr:hypothetical protein [Gammaproteobacteria bacterium]